MKEQNPSSEQGQLIEMSGEWLTTRKMAEVLNPFMSFALISKLCNQGNMPFEVQRIRNRWYAKREAVEAYLQKITQK